VVDGQKEIDLEKCYKKRNDSSLSPAGLAAGQEIDLPARADLSSPGKINSPLSLSLAHIDRERERSRAIFSPVRVSTCHAVRIMLSVRF